MELPAGLSVVQFKTHPFRMFSPAQIVPNPDGTTAIYWTDIDFKKSSKRLFRAEVIADDCAPETLDVSALAYLVNATDLYVYCVAPLAEPVVLRVRYPGDKKTGSGKHASSRPVTCAPTPAPSVNPATPFVPYGLGQRCLQAGRLAPFGVDRRMSAEAQVAGEADSRDNIHEERRRLGPEVISTPSDCWDYCSLNGGEPVGSCVGAVVGAVVGALVAATTTAKASKSESRIRVHSPPQQKHWLAVLSSLLPYPPHFQGIPPTFLPPVPGRPFQNFDPGVNQTPYIKCPRRQHHNQPVRTCNTVPL